MASRKFLVPANLLNLAEDPATGTSGDIYFNTTSDKLKIYDGSTWVEVGSGGGSTITVSATAPVSPNAGDAWYQNTTGSFYIYDGSFWVEVNGVVGLSQEEIQDYVAPLFTHSNHTNASVTYEDASNELHIDVTNAPSAGYTAVLKHDVRLNGSIAKGQAVYVSSSNGTNMIVSKASNASEATSSKTLGLLETGGTNNALVKIVTEGLLAGLDTSTAGTEGDPVWLGTDGNLIYGLLNKPVAPAHLVFIGIVTRKNANNGEIFVKVQNGFELKEIHDVLIDTPADNEVLAFDDFSGLWINQTAVEAGLIDTSATEQTKAGNLIIEGNLTVNGTTTTLNTENLAVEDNIVILNSTVTGTPSLNSGIEVERGTSDNVSLLWNESSDKWTLTNDGTTSYPIATQNGYTYDSVINIRSYDGITDGAINIEAYQNKIQLSDDDGITITSGAGTKSFAFNNSGNITLPGNITFSDSSAQTTAFLGMASYDTDDLEEGVTNLYFTDTRAVDALATTLGNYLTEADALTTYLTQVDAASTYQPIGSYIEIETDPIFTASEAFNITSTDTTNWDSAYGWGDHSLEGYALDSHNHTLDSLSNVVITGTPTDGQAIVWDTTTSKWVNETISAGDAFPSQTGNDGKFLQTDGTDVSWADETDPVFIASAAYNIISLDISNWNAAYGWGDHSLAGYLTEYLEETDPIYTASSWYTTTNNSSNWDVASGAVFAGNSNWDTAYGWGDHSTVGYLTSESDTLETVTDRGATSSNAITISNTTQSTTPTSGALIISGGVGIAKDVWIDGDLHVNGTTVTENTKTVATHDNLIYLNAAQDSDITNAVGDGTYVTYTAENNYTPGMDIRVTGMDPSGYNIASADGLTVYSATSTQFVVAKTTTGTFVSGGISHAKEEVNPDLGFAGGYYNAGYAHAGLFRDASDGVFKFFQGYTPEPDEAVNIDTTHASFALADISANNIQLDGSINFDVVGGTPTGSISINNGPGYDQFRISAADWLSLSATNNISLTSVNGLISLDSIGDKVVISGTNGEFLNNHTVAGNQIATIGDLSSYAPLSSPTFTGNVTIGEAITKTTSTDFTSSSPTTIATFPVPSGNCIAVECVVLISSTSNGSYTASKILITADPDFNAVADITEYAVMKNNDYDLFPVLTATISGSNVLLRAAVASPTNATAKVISTSILSPQGAA
jgi:hypothetical protein